MNKLNNYVITDPYEPAIDIDTGSPFRTALRSDAEFIVCAYDAKLGPERGVVSAVRETIAKLTGTGELRNYVILTKRPAVFAKEFISNNVIDITGKTEKQVANEVDWVFSDFGKNDMLGENTFIIGDCHFFHKNIIKYCNRPWNDGYGQDGNMIVTDENVRQMNEDLIRNWNSVVGKNDIVYVNGDFCFGNIEKVRSVVCRLNGKKRLVIGNHDRLRVKDYYEAGFERVYDKKIIINDYIIISHTPLEFLNDNCPFFSCYAHVHDSEMYRTFTRTSCCTSVERHNYTPISLKYIQQKVNELDD